MATSACCFLLDEMSFPPTAQVSQDKIDQPCDQWQVWASKSRKRKQYFRECFRKDTLLHVDDLIENDYIDSRVENHMRLEYVYSSSRRSLAQLPVDETVNRNDMVQQQKKQRVAKNWSGAGGDSTTSRRATPRIKFSLRKAS